MLKSVTIRDAVYSERVQEESWDADNAWIVGDRSLISAYRLLI